MADLINREDTNDVESGDFVARAEILKLIRFLPKDECENDRLKAFANGYNQAMTSIAFDVDTIPPADTERHAHWILVDNDITTFVYQCSNCKDTIAVPIGMINEFIGCPYCLSRMDEVME